MRTLEELLLIIPTTYADLEAALIPASAARGDGGSMGDPLNRPAPARLDVIECRHVLLRGLRWWVDALDDGASALPSASSVPGMCRWLSRSVGVMDPDDMATMHGQLDEWYGAAMSHRGAMEPKPVSLPSNASEQVVRVADAAALLGCTVRTIQRRVPADQRPGGMVKLYDAMPFCSVCDLKVGAGCGCVVKR